jgi:hypothetical protein
MREMMKLPAPDRLALARELLPEGFVVAREVGDSESDACLNPYSGDYDANPDIAYENGWNACRAAMMREGDAE